MGAWLVLGVAAVALGCGDDTRGDDPFSGVGLSNGGTDPGSASADGDDGAGTGGGADDDGGGGEGPKLDVQGQGDADDDGGGDDGPKICHVVDMQDGMAGCNDVAPPDSFEPEVQWAWSGVDGLDQVVTTPLVANLTDDNDDGVVDLCDVPDIVVIAYKSSTEASAAGPSTGYYGNAVVLDGGTGSVHAVGGHTLLTTHTPALADIDNDGVAEIIAVELQEIANFADNPPGRLVAFEADGTPLWGGQWDLNAHDLWMGGVAVADLDNNGDAEIMADGRVFDHNGTQLWAVEDRGQGLATAVDLDNDGDLEVVLGAAAYQHDGTLLFDHSGGDYGNSVVADFDNDGLPEIAVVHWTGGITIIEHDGTVSTSTAMSTHAAERPAAVHDIDGDHSVEILIGHENSFSVLDANLGLRWSATTDDWSGASGSTAFDFLGDGSAEAMYADETDLFVYGQGGGTMLNSPRASWTALEYPVVADVDNDGSAEIVVTSNYGYYGSPSPAVQVIRDIDDRWVPARRIWNQHTYHVTNIREDGTLPMVEPHHWETLNTFRTQAQIADGGVCDPVPEG
ncbi:MAG: VCBS repeat-containing protein [Myxococcota bacterium]